MSSASTLAERLESVHDRTSFLEFVRALVDDRRDEVRREERAPSSPYGPGANGWENISLEAFLDASVAWADDVSQLTDERQAWFPETPSWQVFARFLYMGKLYE